MEHAAEVVVSIRDGKFEIRGSETFVADHYKALEKLMLQVAGRTEMLGNEGTSVDFGADGESVEPSAKIGKITALDHVFSVEGGVLHVIKSPPRKRNVTKGSELGFDLHLGPISAWERGRTLG
jgi:hypothetical protein